MGKKLDWENYYKDYYANHSDRILKQRQKYRLKKSLSEPRYRHWYKYTITKHGNYLGVYKNLVEVAAALGMTPGYVNHLLRGKMEFYIHGFLIKKEIR